MAHTRILEQANTHRLIPAKYAQNESVLEDLNLPRSVIEDLSELDAATNERKVAERGGNLAMGLGELLFGVPFSHIVNSAFTHPGPDGGRFNSAERGAWYAGFALETCIAEVTFHRRRLLIDTRAYGLYMFEYADFLADFSGEFHYLDDGEAASCLVAGPIPDCYREPQALARRLLFSGSSGIVYPSVRHADGVCIACFRPALVFHPRAGAVQSVVVDTRMQSGAAGGSSGPYAVA